MIRSSYSGRRRRKDGGFTFVEVLAAMLFMAIVIPVAVQGIALANRAGVIAERKTVAAQLADSFLTELVVTETWQNQPGSGTFPGIHREYEWRLEQRNWDIDPLIYLEVQVAFTVQAQEHLVRTSTLIEEPEE